MKPTDITRLHDDVRRALGWECNCDGVLWNPKAPDRDDVGFVCLDEFKPAWNAEHMMMVLDHMHMRGYGWNLDSYGDHLGEPYTCCFTKDGDFLDEAEGETVAIAVCRATIKVLTGTWVE